MPKKTPVRTLMDSELVKGPERLLRSARQDFCHIFSSFQKEIQLEKLSFSSVRNFRTVC